ncbi:16S rRNA (uracil(1498)-N(3))-methyltransferase [Jeotgalibaca sp. MA1X17-3]|uniref:16S rRNA (uracil(1498)-N(3))-methyltransferase n=1 Tax=Jeotgalibaca sp. MA1X17-3 TaxID=2908211 RepID=UPI001F454A6A|nr:16S rRNA (uracil(1498)-N(3))-methyltransferase [Jeotgalibaca sp. MA1X17-3]UJF14713.1 16S rRNA (uracil(1498)-N(3))-methyltransferase [Jeotgalibaca sp. MA1X17-3]
MQRYMISHSLEKFPEAPIQLVGEHYHHMKNVMRFKPKTKVFLTDATGYSCIAEITSLTNEYVELHWVKEETINRELPVHVTIACGLSKGDKLDLVVQKSTELGVNKVIPFKSKYSVVKWDEGKVKKKQQRFQKIASEAAEQSHRQSVPVIEEMKNIEQLINYSQTYAHKLVAYEEEAKTGELGRFVQTLQKMKPGEDLLIVFGPEGGLDPSEMELFQDHGFISCGLGPRIMRAETAPLYTLAAISYHYELLN